MAVETLPQEKTCTKCGETKPLEEFNRDRSQSSGRECKCKVCKAVADRRRNQNSAARQRQVATARRWIAKNPDRRDSYNAQRRKRRQENPEMERERERRWRAANPERKAAHSKRYVARHPTKAHARQQVNHAVRDGRLSRPDRCEDCGGEGELSVDGRVPIQAHHANYSKPFDVEWLCRTCHAKRHHEERE